MFSRHAVANRLTWMGALLVAGCGVGPVRDGIPSSPPDLSAVFDAVPRVEAKSRYGNPPSYVVNGRRYYTSDSSHGYVKRGIASWYGTKFHGRRTSSGEVYDMYAMTAAHRSLPLPTYVRVTNLRNNRRIVVRVNDRGPFHGNRLIDLSYTAAYKLGMVGKGTAPVKVEAINPKQQLVVRPVALENSNSPTSTLAAPESLESSIYLQVGAFVDRRNARRMQSRVAQVSPAMVRIVEAAAGGTTVYRVQLGPLPNVEQADRLAYALAEHGLGDASIVME